MKQIHNFSYKFWKINRTRGHNKYYKSTAPSETQLSFETLRSKKKKMSADLLGINSPKHINAPDPLPPHILQNGNWKKGSSGPNRFPPRLWSTIVVNCLSPPSPKKTRFALPEDLVWRRFLQHVYYNRRNHDLIFWWNHFFYGNSCHERYHAIRF